MKYRVIEDGGFIEIKPGTIQKISCCDCGLVHNMAVAIGDNGDVGLAFKINERATGQRRRHMKRTGGTK